MAIKERKQITGTTEQINAYAGHEGQIVWDKEKKTFVGMSGTAGKNYPLAPQAYVDTQFLPLSGGVLTGNIKFDTGAIISGMSQDGSFRELLLGSDAIEDYSNNSGAYIALRNQGGSRDDLRGSFALHTRLANATIPYMLEGKTNGDLTWGGKEVDRVNSISENHIRYESGLQICWGGIHIPNGRINATVTMPVPYRDVAYVGIATYNDVNNTTIGATVTVDSSTRILVAVTSIAGKYDWPRMVKWLTIGRWK